MSGPESSALRDAFTREVPRHIAIVMDGNGRWAKGRSLPRIAGHQAGVEAVRGVLRACADQGVEVLTLFAFSSENWRRPETEVRLLLDLFVRSLEREARKLHDNNVRLRVIGEREAFSRKLQRLITAAEELTQDNDGLTLVIAANYGGRWDMTQAARRLAEQAVAGEIEPSAISAETIQTRLSLHGLPEPDLFIRTGGEKRFSNFLLWELAYTELYFTDTLWPDFDAKALDAAFASFAQRQRRFGHTGEQVEQIRRA